MHTVGVEDEGRVWDVVLASGLGETQSLLEHGEDRLRHGLGSPGLERSTLSEAKVVHQTLIGVPTLLPHALQLVLVAVCWKSQTKRELLSAALFIANYTG